MIKFLFVGLWACLVTLGACYGAMTLFVPNKVDSDTPSYFDGIETMKTAPVGVPIIRAGKMHGYIVFQLVYTIGKKVAKSVAVTPDAFLVNAAYMKFYSDPMVNYGNLRKQDLLPLLQEIRDSVNKRYGKKVVYDVLIERLNYLSADSVRMGQTKNPGPSAKVSKKH